MGSCPLVVFTSQLQLTITTLRGSLLAISPSSLQSLSCLCSLGTFCWLSGHQQVDKEREFACSFSVFSHRSDLEDGEQREVLASSQ